MGSIKGYCTSEHCENTSVTLHDDYKQVFAEQEADPF